MEKEKDYSKNRFSTNIQRQAILDLESGEFRVSEVMEKYGIRYSATLRPWGLKFSKTPEKYVSKNKKTSKTTRIKAVKEISLGFLSLEEVAKKYGVKPNTVGTWVRYLSSKVDFESLQIQEEDVEATMTIDEKNRIKELENALKAEQLKVLGLETMIDIAEKNYQFDIRKKFGSKQ
ncbi:MAG: transposase [Bacteroidetes bacterium]|nr:transposase [Bacteroidota bacterium]